MGLETDKALIPFKKLYTYEKKGFFEWKAQDL